MRARILLFRPLPERVNVTQKVWLEGRRRLVERF